MKKLFGITSVVALLVGTSAFAADAIVYNDQAPMAPDAVFSWTGGYIGLHGGYGWGKTHDKNNPAAEKKDIDGGLAGIQAGYNSQLDNNLVLGVEGDVSFGSVNEKWRDGNQYSGYHTEDKVMALGTLRARLGYAAGNFMPYVTGGLAIGKTKHTLGCGADLIRNQDPAGQGCKTNGPKDEFQTSKSDTSTGYVVGVGGEYAFTNNWTFKAEYLYTDLGKNSVTLVDPNFPAAINARKFDTNFSTVRLGVNYKF